MRDHDTYDYAVIRVVPRVEREEFQNVGVVVSCPPRGFLEARIEFDPARLTALSRGGWTCAFALPAASADSVKPSTICNRMGPDG